MSPDTIVPDPDNLFDYNRYLYARGNPLKFSDPSGHYCVPGINLGTTCTSGGETWDKIQLTLDGAGLIDPTPASDGINAIVYAARGNWTDAGISVVAMLPYLGDLAKGARYGDEVWAIGSSFARFAGDALGLTDEGIAAFKSFTSDNFRDNLGILTRQLGGSVPNGVQAHHILPQKFEGFFAARRINIHEPQFGVWVETSKHAQGWSKFQQAWATWIGENPNATVEEIMRQANKLTEEFGYVNPNVSQ